METPLPTLDTCPVCVKEIVESGFLVCKTCWQNGKKICLRCLRAAAMPKQAFCSSCWARRGPQCDRCKVKPACKGELLCSDCWKAVNMCPLCKIKKLESTWNICKPCFHANSRLCLKCRKNVAFPGKQVCSSCEAVPIVAPSSPFAPPSPSTPSSPSVPPANAVLREITLAKFLALFESFITHERTKIVFFVGAGCSISSGIPAAGRLVLEWNFPANTPYIDAITTKFPLRSQRGEEFWRLCHDKQPGEGYQRFATLIRRLKPRMNLLLTTNFDHMIRRALPEVLDASDPYKAQFAPWWLDHNSPVLFQLHGDYTTLVANTQDEMHNAIEHPLCRERESVPIEVSAVLRPLLQRRPQVLIVMGYSGNDLNIRELFSKTDFESGSVYWINGNKPTPDNCKMYDVLLTKQVTWVNHLSFDTFVSAMVEVADRVMAAAAPASK